jgi:hypothetical protein
MAKTPSRPEVSAPAVTLDVGGDTTTLRPAARVFSTGSHGFFGTAKVTDPASGERLQVTVQAVVIGSKDWS